MTLNERFAADHGHAVSQSLRPFQDRGPLSRLPDGDGTHAQVLVRERPHHVPSMQALLLRLPHVSRALDRLVGAPVPPTGSCRSRPKRAVRERLPGPRESLRAADHPGRTVDRIVLLCSSGMLDEGAGAPTNTSRVEVEQTNGSFSGKILDSASDRVTALLVTGSVIAFGAIINRFYSKRGSEYASLNVCLGPFQSR